MIENISEEQFRALDALLNEPKFAKTAHYPGAPTEKIRSRCEARVNDFLQFIELNLRGGTDKATLYSNARALVASFDREDTEERERVGDYVGDAMRILELHDWIEHV
jgi:hypothetical protein